MMCKKSCLETMQHDRAARVLNNAEAGVREEFDIQRTVHRDIFLK
jgi:BMFP domain-containing protein YqiC